MSWTKSTTTKHACNDGNGPAFGRKTPGCPRCDELLSGAKPVQWAHTARQLDRQRAAEYDAHISGQRHRSGGCGPVCTFGDW